jgi:hypothetical protein
MYFRDQQEIDNLAIKIAQLKEIEKQKEEKELAFKIKIDNAEQDLIKKVNNIFANQAFKFKAKLSDCRKYVEVYSQKNILVGKYEQMPQNNLFKAVDGTIAGLERGEEILLGKMKDSLFSIMEGCFR